MKIVPPYSISEGECRFLLENTVIGICISNVDGNVVAMNQAMFKMSGFTLKELSGIGLHDMYVTHEDYEKYVDRIKQDGKVENFEVRQKKKDGEIYWVNLSTNPILSDGSEVFFTTVADITKYKKAEEGLRRSKRLYGFSSRLNQAVITNHDREALFQEVCTIAVEVGKFGLAWIGMVDKENNSIESVACYGEGSDNLHDFSIPLSDKMNDCGPVTNSIRNGKIVVINDLGDNIKHAPWSTQAFNKGFHSTASFPIRLNNTIIGSLNISSIETHFFDDSEISLLEEATSNISFALEKFKEEKNRKQIAAERERLTAAIEQSAETVVITDVEGNIQYVNPAFEQITGYTKEEALGQNPRILKSGEQDKSFYQQLWNTISNGLVWHGKMKNRRKDGSHFTEEVTISPVFDTAGTISNYVAVKRDITKEQELEQQIQQAQKMESIGTLAGGVAHDFNNMLSVITGFSELALAKLDPTDTPYKDIKQVYKAGQRSIDLIRQLLVFARKQTMTPRVLDLNNTIDKMLRMLRRLIGEDLKLIWTPGANMGNILIDPAQVDQIVANLCVNARDAIDSVGQIIIGTENVTLDQSYCQTHAYAEPGAYVLLTVSDNGCGMDKTTLDRIFEPFFTTKTHYDGTGLGLSTVYGIVRQNKGLISVNSEPYQGTTFKIYFPCHSGDEVVKQEKIEEKHHTSQGELVMLVEDETIILELVQSMLENNGYRVIATDKPLEALRLAEEEGEPIELLITDVVMPDLNGKELAGKLQSFYPEMKSLFMSGYTSNIIANHGVVAGDVNFICKPFSQHELTVKLNEVLGT